VRPSSAPGVVRRPLGWDLAPVDVLRLVRSDAHPIALIGAWADGADVISSEPALVRSPPHSLADVFDSPCVPGAGAASAVGHADHARQLRAGLADPAFLLAILFCVSAIFVFFSPPAGLTSRLRLVVDALIVGSGLVLASWLLVLGPAYDAHSRAFASDAQALGYLIIRKIVTIEV